MMNSETNNHMGMKILVVFLGFLIISGITILAYSVMSGKKPFSPPPPPAGYNLNLPSDGLKFDSVNGNEKFLYITQKSDNFHKITIIDANNGAIMGSISVQP